MTYPLYLSALVAGAAGCLAVPDDQAPPMCETTSDCDHASGEICDDGVCWGDPPPGIYAARIGPPGNTTELVPTEITDVELDAKGWFTTPLRLEAAVIISGNVTLDCSDGLCPAIASTITISRPSRIPGGPPFVTVAHTTEDSGTFRIAVPRAEADEEYAIVVTPDRTNDDLINLDAVAPKRQLLYPNDDVELDITLGSGGRVVTGQVLDTDNLPLAGARVVVRGRWDDASPLTDISCVATTDSAGAYRLYLTESTVVPTAEVVVTPPDDPLVLRPTLIRSLDLDGPLAVTSLRMPDLGDTQALAIPITGTSPMGLVVPIANAEVTLVAEQLIMQLPSGYTARIEVGATTLANGEAHVQVLDAAALEYELHVKPPPQSGNAQYATIYGGAVDIVGTTRLTPILLANQVTIRGTLHDHAGRIADGVNVTAVPNASYAASLEDDLQRKLAELVPTTDTTDMDGGFQVGVDPNIDGATAMYDINFEPPQHSLLPRWQNQSLVIDEITGLDLQDLDLPPAAYVRGDVHDAEGNLLEGAEVRLYEIPSALLPCARATDPLADPACAERAILRAVGVSDSGGEVHLVLPDP